MSPLIPTLTALLVIFGAGFGVNTLLPRNTQRIAMTELIALSWLLGGAVISLSLWLLGISLRGVLLQVAVTIISLGLTLIGVAQWRKNRLLLRVPWPLNWIEGVLGTLLCLEIALVFLFTFQHTLGWDGLLIWELKARYAYLNGGALPAEYFVDATRAFSHQDYPLFLPMIEMWLYFWIGNCDQYWVKLIFPVFYAVGTVLLAQAGASWSRKRWVGLLAANLLLFVPFLTRAAGGIILGYADVPLSIVYLAAFYFLSVFASENSKTALSAFIVLTAILPWIKQEGIILWFVLGSCGAFIIWRRRGIFPALVSILPGVAMILSWKIYLIAMHARSSQDFLSINFSLLHSNFYRLGPILASLFKEATTVSHWSLLWLATSVAFLCFAFCRRNERAILVMICSVVPLALYCCTYLFSAWPDYLHHVGSSLPRLLLQVAPLSILSIALALAPRRNHSPTQADR
jgi:hypothetical protein